MQIQFWQIILISAYAFWMIIDALSFNVGFNRPVIAGFFTGLFLGDIQTGLFVGGSLQLMILGIGTFGGASIPEYATASIIGTVIAVSSTLNPEEAVVIAVPVGLLLINLDVLARFTNSYFQHRADHYAEVPDTDKVLRSNILGMIPWGLSRMLPVLIVLVFGSSVIQTLVDVTPAWLIAGLRVAGGMLPAVGFAILLRFVPTPKHITWLILGFVLAAFLKMSLIGIALIGLAAGIYMYMQRIQQLNTNPAVGGADGDE